MARLYATGWNAWGQFGLPNGFANTNTLAEVSPGVDWTAFSFTWWTSVGVRRDGTLWGSGNNESGQLGTGASYTESFVQIGSDSDWYSVATVYNSTFAIKADGTLWACGSNTYGQLGSGDKTSRNTLAQVGSDSGWASIYGLYERGVVALKTDGTLWAWGANENGRLGLGDKLERLVPTQIGSDTTWVAVRGGTNGAIALKSDGTVWSWGANTTGRLGLGDTAERLVPTQIPITGVAAISGGGSATYVVKTNGELWGCGAGTLVSFNGSVVGDQLSMIRLGVDSDWLDVCITYAIKTDGTLWAWGSDTYGQVGNGAATGFVYAPVNISPSVTDWSLPAPGGYTGFALAGDLWPPAVPPVISAFWRNLFGQREE